MTLEQWLLPVAGAVADIPDRDTFRQRVESIRTIGDDIPPSVINRRTQRAAMEWFAEFPSASELKAFFRLCATVTGADEAPASKPEPRPETDPGLPDWIRSSQAFDEVKRQWEASSAARLPNHMYGSGIADDVPAQGPVEVSWAHP